VAEIMLKDSKTYDTLIIGGGPAGISAAMHLTFHKRNIAIIDRLTSPMNFYTNPVNNFPGVRPLTRGTDILRKMKNEVKEYGVTIKFGNIINITGKCPDFRIHIESIKGEDGIILGARSLVFATGVSRKHPCVNGSWRRWLPFAGKNNISYYCPDCESPLTSGKDVLVINAGTVNSALHIARSIKPFARRVRIFMTEDAFSDFKNEYREILHKSGFEWTSGLIKKIIINKPGEQQKLYTVSGDILECECSFISYVAIPRSKLAVSIGVEVNNRGYIISDHRGKTNIEGVWAAGDIRNITQSVAMAVGTGNYVGIMIDQFLSLLDKNSCH
jgi:thioredoxin reductase (NADPH)